MPDHHPEDVRLVMALLDAETTGCSLASAFDASPDERNAAWQRARRTRTALLDRMAALRAERDAIEFRVRDELSDGWVRAKFEASAARAERDGARAQADERLRLLETLWHASDGEGLSNGEIRRIEELLATTKKTTPAGADDHTQLEHFRCRADCGAHVVVDEDGCCTTCGADCDEEECDCQPYGSPVT